MKKSGSGRIFITLISIWILRSFSQSSSALSMTWKLAL